MPTYDYACRHCGVTSEVWQAFADAPLTVCEACGQSTLKRVINVPPVIFNGPGYYSTDNRKKA